MRRVQPFDRGASPGPREPPAHVQEPDLRRKTRDDAARRLRPADARALRQRLLAPAFDAFRETGSALMAFASPIAGARSLLSSMRQTIGRNKTDVNEGKPRLDRSVPPRRRPKRPEPGHCVPQTQVRWVWARSLRSLELGLKAETRSLRSLEERGRILGNLEGKERTARASGQWKRCGEPRNSLDVRKRREQA